MLHEGAITLVPALKLQHTSPHHPFESCFAAVLNSEIAEIVKRREPARPVRPDPVVKVRGPMLLDGGVHTRNHHV